MQASRPSKADAGIDVMPLLLSKRYPDVVGHTPERDRGPPESLPEKEHPPKVTVHALTAAGLKRRRKRRKRGRRTAVCLRLLFLHFLHVCVCVFLRI